MSYYLLLLLLPLGLVSYGHTQLDRPDRWPDDGGWSDYDRSWLVPGYPGKYRGSIIDRHRWPNKLDVGDTRCPSAITQNSEIRTIVELPGNALVEGRIVYLCDGPGVPVSNRPNQAGTVTEFYGNVSVFLGIPYAEPPTPYHNNRFRPPKVKGPWDVLNATAYKPACPQAVRYYGLNMGVERIDEDCLYLNVFTPTAQRDMATKYAVMVYVHGGNWDHGNVNSFPAHLLAASQEVVVVTLNYRLGVLGFLATGDHESPGNYGLLDQAMAIQWVYDYIPKFNGDPKRIVLFGPGAGAASSGLHAISSKSADMISSVIAQSGSVLADWAVITDPAFAYNSSRLFGRAVGCTMESSYDLVECLRSRPISELVNVDKKPQVGRLSWGPVLDNYTRDHDNKDPFFAMAPEDAIEVTNFPVNFKYMAGVTRDEAVSMIYPELERTNYIVDNLVFSRKVKEYMKMYNYALNPEAIYNAIQFMYSDGNDPYNITLVRQNYIDMLSDSCYNAPNDKIVKKLLAKGVDVYMYVLNYAIEGRKQEPWHGVPHNTEYFLITGAPFMDTRFYPKYYNLNGSRWTEADRNMSQLFMQAWANFAKAGNPTSEWQPMRMHNLQYLSINATSVVLRDYRQKECQFWNEYLPSLIDKISPSPPETEEQEVYVFWGVIAAILFFLVLTFKCCCRYCRAKRSRRTDHFQGKWRKFTRNDKECLLVEVDDDFFRLRFQKKFDAAKSNVLNKLFKNKR